MEATQAVNVLTFEPLIKAGISDDIRKCIESGVNVVAEHEYKTKWGKDIYKRIHLTPRRDALGKVAGVQALVEDFTEYKRAHQAVKKSEEEFRATFEQAVVGMVHADMSGRWVKVNKKFCDIVGYTSEELTKTEIFRYYSPR
ncbi:MAG: hypothetical protein CVV03_11475 [Firmicutes bacterium HGW-Firmicutes-8]|nr:MAG: hypothetical protein CVV03_11475 [Firmicutes bacterium HGW-Firmicutes-8]